MAKKAFWWGGSKLMSTEKQKRGVKLMIENEQMKIGKNKGQRVKTKGEILKEAGYGKNAQENPKEVEGKIGWQELMEKHLPDDLLAKKHKALLNSTRIEHMVFPKAVDDNEIKKLLKSVNCSVRKIMHGDTANHVWFWAADNNAVNKGLDMGYKLKGKYTAEKHQIEHEIIILDEQTKKEINSLASRRNRG